MICVALQDYTNIRSDSGVSLVTQEEPGWLDLSAYQDLVAFLEVKELSGATTIQIAYQTAPTKDESLFVSMSSLVTLAAGLTTTKMLRASASVPVSRWVRWQLSASGISGAWDVMFRVWLAASRSSKRGAVQLSSDTRARMLAAEPSVPLSRRATSAGIVTGNMTMLAGGATGAGGNGKPTFNA